MTAYKPINTTENTKNKQFLTKCLVCFESQCKHWDISVKENTILENDGYFTKTYKTEQIFIVKCNICDKSSEVKHNPGCYMYKSCCKFEICLYYGYNISNDTLINYCNQKNIKIPRKYCKTCKTTGNIPDTFKKCDKCDGTGGMICNKCNGHYKLYENIICNECKQGYLHLCKYCNGHKAVINTTVPCNKCK